MTTFSLPGRYVPTDMPVRRFSVDEYHRLIEDGYFSSDERFELLEGFIVQKMPRDPVHDVAVEIAHELLRARLPEGWRIRVQSAITTNDSEPEPDLAVVRGQPRDHMTAHPGPSDVALVVEVSNTTLRNDQTNKARVYARAGVRVYWIINLVDRRAEVYEEPTGPDAAPAYRRRADYRLEATIPLVIGGIAVAPILISELLP